jgi:phosphate transport system substrate-binding protein
MSYSGAWARLLKQIVGVQAALLSLALLAACARPGEGALTGSIPIDGSSTVYPITEAVGEEFRLVHRNVRVTVGISGTGGGFSRFCAGEIFIADASRPIRPSEAEVCDTRGIEFIELPVAYDALTIVVHPQNSFVDCMTPAELKKLWEPAAQGTITRWNQVRPEWPDQAIRLYAPGVDSGTFDYFTEAINGQSYASRGDFVASEDDNVLVQGVSGDRNSLGYFGLAYYLENERRLKAVPIDDGKGCIEPSIATVEAGDYTPLSRPLLIYVRKDVTDRPEVRAFVDFYLEYAGDLASEVGYVRLPEHIYELAKQRFETGKTGSVYTGDTAGKTLEQLYAAN